MDEKKTETLDHPPDALAKGAARATCQGWQETSSAARGDRHRGMARSEDRGRGQGRSL